MNWDYNYQKAIGRDSKSRYIFLNYTEVYVDYMEKAQFFYNNNCKKTEGII